MKLDRAIKLQYQLVSRVNDAYSSARLFKITHEELLKRREQALAVPNRTPRHVLDYARGYAQALDDALYRQHLVFGGYIGDTFYSTHHDRDDYYGKHGVEPAAYSDDGLVKRRGHYWADDTSKPFFLG